jgi:hypothetical protein
MLCTLLDGGGFMVYTIKILRGMKMIKNYDELQGNWEALIMGYLKELSHIPIKI